MEAERIAYSVGARQGSFFDKDLAAIEPIPYQFGVRFQDTDGWHHHSCEDWETSAAFWKLRRHYGEEKALQHLNDSYNEIYPKEGMLLALGTMAKRPKTWLLLGMIRVNSPSELRLIP